MKRHLKYIKHKDGRETFITRQYWSKHSDECRPMAGHLVLVSTDRYSVEIVRVPSPHRGLNRGKATWKVEADMWNRLCKDRGYIWWSYLTPDVAIPLHPKKKYYSEGELHAHVRLEIRVLDQEVY